MAIYIIIGVVIFLFGGIFGMFLMLSAIKRAVDKKL